jgi:RNA polymerase sigma-70 factor (sigma-E family)
MTVRPRRRVQRHEAVHPPAAPLRAVPTFEAFYEREIRSVIGLAYALSGSRTAAEDLAHDAFLAAHRSWERISRYDRPEAWVRRVVSNLSVSRFRRKVREAKAIARLGEPGATLPELPAAADEFWGAVRSLPRRQAQAIALHYLEDRPVAEIAEILECSPNTVKVHLHKGRKRLARRLGLEEGGIP